MYYSKYIKDFNEEVFDAGGLSNVTKMREKYR
jgi:hypothetical protein